MPFPPDYTNVWDTTFPPDTQLANLLGQDLRHVRTDVMQRLSLLSGTLANRPVPETVNATWGGVGFGLLYFATDTSQVFQWNGAAWVDVTTSIGSPIVARVNLTAQAADIASTTLFIPTVNGFYRISGYVVQTQVATNSCVLPAIQYSFTDADSNQPEVIGLSKTNNSNILGITTLQDVLTATTGNCFFAKTGVAIKYNTTGYFSNGATPMQFGIHVRLESLG